MNDTSVGPSQRPREDEHERRQVHLHGAGALAARRELVDEPTNVIPPHLHSIGRSCRDKNSFIVLQVARLRAPRVLSARARSCCVCSMIVPMVVSFGTAWQGQRRPKGDHQIAVGRQGLALQSKDAAA